MIVWTIQDIFVAVVLCIIIGACALVFLAAYLQGLIIDRKRRKMRKMNSFYS